MVLLGEGAYQNAKQINTFALTRQSWCEELHPGQSTMQGTSSVPQLGQGLCLGLSSITMRIRLKKRCKWWCVCLSDILKHIWNAEVFWAGGSHGLVCERSSLTYGLLYYLTHSRKPYLSIRPLECKPRTKGCLRWNTGIFFYLHTLQVLLKCSPLLLRSSCRMCSWNKHYFYN